MLDKIMHGKQSVTFLVSIPVSKLKCHSVMESILVAQNSSRLRPAVWLHLVEESLGGR